MLKNYWRIAIRAIASNRLHTLISLAGLTIGLTTFFAIALFVQDELRYDRFHKNKDNIYRLAMDLGPDFNNPLTPMPLAPAMQATIPGIERTCRIFKNRNSRSLFTSGSKRFYESDYVYADSTFFSLFTFQKIRGDLENVLNKPHTIVLTASAARRYFGTTDAVGQIINIETEADGYEVRAVIDEMPEQSHMHMDFILSLSSMSQEHKDNWLIPFMFTYILVKEHTPVQQLETTLTTIVREHFSKQMKDQGARVTPQQLRVYLQPLTSIHLYSNARVELETNGNIVFVWIVSIAAVLILLLSAINFINLTTAAATIRLKEIAVRKAAGACRHQLIAQFLFESLLLCLLAGIMSMIAMYFVAPLVGNVTGKSLLWEQLFSKELWMVWVGGLLIVALLSGAYPAFYLSALQPGSILKNATTPLAQSVFVRRLLIVIQCMVSLVLVTGVLIISRQLRYMSTRDLGFNKEKLIVLPLHASLTPDKKRVIKSELLDYVGIQSVSFVNYVPGKEAYENQDVFIPEGRTRNEFVPMWYMRGDADLLSTMGFQLVAGRDLDPDLSSNATEYLLNETAVKTLGWTTASAVGKTLSTFGEGPDQLIKGRVIGIVKDFHFENFSHAVKPMVLGMHTRYWWNIVIRIDPKQTSDIMTFLEREWKSFQPDYPFEYYFVDENFASLWSSDRKLSRVLTIFTVLAIVVAAIGLFGLSVFTSTRRTKEIGVRKVLGASPVGIVGLLSREYLALIGTSWLIATPVTAWLGNIWLSEFVYRTSLDVFLFLLPGVAALMTAFLAVSGTSIRAALRNPVTSLRTE
jgi:putative ABC transport system permease protein